MVRTTLKSLLAHKVRLALTAFAIVLGVAFVSGTYVLTDTVKHTFDSLFQQTALTKALVVRGVAPYGTGGGFGDRQTRPLTPEALLPVVRAVPGVRDAAGSLMGSVTLLDANGKALSKQAPTFGTAWNPDAALSSFTLGSGRAPEAGNEVVIDRGTFNDQKLTLGRNVSIITNEGPGRFTVVGTSRFGTADNLAGATAISFYGPSAQALAGKPGYYDQILVSTKAGTAPDAVLTAIGNAVNQGAYKGKFEAVSGQAVANQTASQVETFIGYFRTFLLAFALISLFVGAFLIANTFSILIGQRTRELALLRAVGASRRQVIFSLLGESLAVGIAGSVVGLLLGIPLASGLYGLLRAAGMGLPQSSLQILPHAVWISLSAGVLITVVSSVGPALRASRIPPVAAMREDAVIGETSLRRRAVVGGLTLAAGVALLGVGLLGAGGNPLVSVGLGAALTFIGVATLAPFVAGGLARIIGAPLPAIAGITGRLGQQNAARNPRRTAATASALMIGLAVVSVLATLGASLSASFGSIFNHSVTADYIISNGGREGFPIAAEKAVRATPGVAAVSAYTELDWHEGGASKQVAGIDPVTGPEVASLAMVTGSAAALGKGQLLVDDTVARSRHLHVGDVIPMGFVSTGIKRVVVGGTYKTNDLLDNYLASVSFLHANTDQPRDELILVKSATRTPAMERALTAAVSSYDLKVQTLAQFKAERDQRFNQFLLIAYVLLALSIVIAAFSVVNTMALSVIERTREIGLLRAIGMARRQVRGMVRGEAVVVSLVGAVLGVALGVALGAAVVTAIGSRVAGLGQIVIPYATVIIVLILAAVIGVVSAVFPARRAARLDVLSAIATI